MFKCCHRFSAFHFLLSKSPDSVISQENATKHSTFTNLHLLSNKWSFNLFHKIQTYDLSHLRQELFYLATSAHVQSSTKTKTQESPLTDFLTSGSSCVFPMSKWHSFDWYLRDEPFTEWPRSERKHWHLQNFYPALFTNSGLE